MKILLIATGSRGDVEPFLAIGDYLQKNGHEVICQFPEQFRVLAEDTGLKFEGLTHEFMDLIESEDGKIVMGGGGSFFKKLAAYYSIYKKSLPINNTMLNQQHDLIESIKPDRIVYSSKATYPILWEIQNPGKSIHVSPIPYLVHYVKDHAHIGFSGDYGSFLNKLTYQLLNYVLVKSIVKTNKQYLKQYGIQPHQVREIMLKKKMIYTISQVFFTAQNYWPSNVKVLGYHERNKTQNWTPDEELLRFIAKHPKILFVTFGSMTNPEPEEKTRIILNIITRNNIPTLINTAGGGLIKPNDYSKNLIHFVSQIPYDWVLPKMYAVMHHGGSGTTHLAVKHGCASMIIPHIMDQHIWNDLNVCLGVGPKGIPVNKINVKGLEPKIVALFTESRYKTNAQKSAYKMAKENYFEELYLTIVQ